MPESENRQYLSGLYKLGERPENSKDDERHLFFYSPTTQPNW